MRVSSRDGRTACRSRRQSKLRRASGRERPQCAPCHASAEQPRALATIAAEQDAASTAKRQVVGRKAVRSDLHGGDVRLGTWTGPEVGLFELAVSSLPARAFSDFSDVPVAKTNLPGEQDGAADWPGEFDESSVARCGRRRHRRGRAPVSDEAEAATGANQEAQCQHQHRRSNGEHFTHPQGSNDASTEIADPRERMLTRAGRTSCRVIRFERKPSQSFSDTRLVERSGWPLFQRLRRSQPAQVERRQLDPLLEA